MKKILIYSHDTFGLGNIRRMLGIAQQLLDDDPALSVLMISGSPFIHNLPIPGERFDYLKLPCLNRDLDGAYGVRQLGTGFDDIVSLRAQAIKATVQRFRPDVFLVDKKPCGVARELYPSLQHLARSLHPTRCILLLRDILDEPATTRAVWAKNRYYETLERYYAKILVVGAQDIFDIRRAYALPQVLAERVEFCGYTNRAHLFPAMPGLVRGDANPRVLVTPGGGEDGYALVRCYLDALTGARDANGISSIVVTGPEMSMGHRDDLRKRAHDCARVELLEFTDELPALMRNADLVVSMAGYNTVCEILSIGKPGLVVPRVAPVMEQLIRAQSLAARGMLNYIHPDSLEPAALWRMVVRSLGDTERQQAARRLLDFDGLARVSASVRVAAESVAQPACRPTIRGTDLAQQDETPTARARRDCEDLSQTFRDLRLAGITGT
ncbi:MAG: glycosyltransferase [Gammaproteobacteria bacterium]